jgi:hypothetical protein
VPFRRLDEFAPLAFAEQKQEELEEERNFGHIPRM